MPMTKAEMRAHHARVISFVKQTEQNEEPCEIRRRKLEAYIQEFIRTGGKIAVVNCSLNAANNLVDFESDFTPTMPDLSEGILRVAQ